MEFHCNFSEDWRERKDASVLDPFDHIGVGLRISASGEEPTEAAGQVSGPRFVLKDAAAGWKGEWRLVRRPLPCKSQVMFLFIALLSFGALLGFAMGWGWLSQWIGCALLCAVPAFMFALITIEPMVTGERQSSTVGLAIPFGTLWVGLAATAGLVVGVIARLIAKR